MNAFEILISFGLPTGLVIIIIYLAMFPTRAEKFGALIWRICEKLGICVNYARKKYTQHTIQSNVNGFIESNCKGIPGLGTRSVKVEWVTAESDLDRFLRDGSVVVRIRQSDPHEESIANAIYFFVSAGLLPDAKRYLSQSQAAATDLYVTRRILAAQPRSVLAHFLDNHLHPGLDQGAKKTPELYAAFEQIDEAGLFFPVFLREVATVGQKVFGARKSPDIHAEIAGIIRYLNRYALRHVGDVKVPTTHIGKFSKVALVIAGKSMRIKSTVTPYVKYLRAIHRGGIETAYVLGDTENVQEIRAIHSHLRELWAERESHRFRRTLHTPQGPTRRKCYMMVLEAIRPKEAVTGADVSRVSQT